MELNKLFDILFAERFASYKSVSFLRIAIRSLKANCVFFQKNSIKYLDLG